VFLVGLVILLSACSNSSPFGITRDADGALVLVTSKCEGLIVHRLVIAEDGPDKIPGNEDDNVLWEYSPRSPIVVTRWRLTSRGTKGSLAAAEAGSFPMSLRVTTEKRRKATFTIGFNPGSITSADVWSSRNEPKRGDGFCPADAMSPANFSVSSMTGATYGRVTIGDLVMPVQGSGSVDKSDRLPSWMDWH
jgi:hypothetical protein